MPPVLPFGSKHFSRSWFFGAVAPGIYLFLMAIPFGAYRCNFILIWNQDNYSERPCIAGIGSHVLNEVSRVWRCRGSKYCPLPQCLHLQSILNDQGRTLLAYLLRDMSLSKQARKRIFQESCEEKYFCCTQDDNVRCLLCSKVKKGTHKWNFKRHYDTVLCSKSAADAATTYPFSHYVICIVGCVVPRHREATLSTWLPLHAVLCKAVKISIKQFNWLYLYISCSSNC